MKDNDLGRRASAEPALVASLPEPQGVSAHSGDSQAQVLSFPTRERFPQTPEKRAELWEAMVRLMEVNNLKKVEVNLANMKEIAKMARELVR